MQFLKILFVGITSLVYVGAIVLNFFFCIYIIQHLYVEGIKQYNGLLLVVVYNFWPFLAIFWVLPACWVRRQLNPNSDLWENQWYMNLQYVYWVILLMDLFLFKVLE